MTTDNKDLWHISRPGPLYWSWRCLVCSEPVADHPGPIKLLIHKLKKR